METSTELIALRARLNTIAAAHGGGELTRNKWIGADAPVSGPVYLTGGEFDTFYSAGYLRRFFRVTVKEGFTPVGTGGGPSLD